MGGSFNAKVWLIGLVSVAAVLGTACASADDSDASTAEEPAATAAAPASDPVTAAPEPPSQGVPNVVGIDLQSAQDTLQAAGYRHLDSIDDTGRNRNQIIDSNWVVVSQLPAAGDQVSTAYEITLFVVKDDEL